MLSAQTLWAKKQENFAGIGRENERVSKEGNTDIISSY
jgi:hypothetical protein